MLAELGPDRAAARAYQEACRRSRHLGRPILASWTRPAHAADPIAFFAQAHPSADRALWLRPSSAEALVGVGSASVLLGQGPERFSQVKAAWQALLADAVIDDVAEEKTGHDEHTRPSRGGPLLLGGFSFDPLRHPSALWRGFPEGRLVLPERTLVVRNGATWLTTNVLVDAIGSPDSSEEEPHLLVTAGAPAEPAALSAHVWQALVGAVARGIRHGQLGVEKVVLARAQSVQQPQPIDPAHALRTLADSYPSCTVFAVGHGDGCFLGATPERLIGLRDGIASTMALAGSISRGATPEEDEALAQRLLHDPKERGEHAVVVGALRDGLARNGMCSRVITDAEPRVRKLANVQHLLTPIRGQVAPGTGVLDLVERLHPTPAVGGFPSQRALELIRAYEALDRGWYGGPIGWLDRHQDGEFVVGIRSALVRRESATLFAGCGIVARSNAAAEYAESGWKLRPMLAALGVAT